VVQGKFVAVTDVTFVYVCAVESLLPHRAFASVTVANSDCAWQKAESLGSIRQSAPEQLRAGFPVQLMVLTPEPPLTVAWYVTASEVIPGQETPVALGLIRIASGESGVTFACADA